MAKRNTKCRVIRKNVGVKLFFKKYNEIKKKKNVTK